MRAFRGSEDRRGNLRAAAATFTPSHEIGGDEIFLSCEAAIAKDRAYERTWKKLRRAEASARAVKNAEKMRVYFIAKRKNRPAEASS
jgi:hypothetical protein